MQIFISNLLLCFKQMYSSFGQIFHTWVSYYDKTACWKSLLRNFAKQTKYKRKKYLCVYYSNGLKLALHIQIDVKFGNSDTKHLPMANNELCASCGGCNELTVHSSHKFQNNSPFIMCRKNILVHCSPLHIHRAASEWVQTTINHRLLPHRVKNVQTTKNIAIDLHVSRHLQTKCKREKKINTQQ